MDQYHLTDVMTVVTASVVIAAPKIVVEPVVEVIVDPPCESYTQLAGA